ncbi:helix-turn-helix transcriptional regulator [Streptomyces sp. 549]|uniref:helix-turn-helix domain-containing protein n=1 Tax=Streptomyces sp. 549 TaxID=3049076 RepID=UPI0024C2CC05|nr:helix-turn-helix transcriptional regulator [Streptomyces sp. 549]MDK1472572.1 helix-turn-helix transcriptional regulator [Streptomyces sp. 549]
MPARAVPSARQRRLGVELRKMRESAGLSVSQAASGLGVDRTRISNIEAGRVGISGERVEAFASLYDCSDRDYVCALAGMAAERRRGWWEEYRETMAVGALDLAELEHHAVGLRAVQMMHIPGLLQTEAYARAVFATAVPEPTPVELRRRLSHRMRRRDVLDRVQPPDCTFLLHEAALRLEFGGSSVMRSQLRYVLDESERDNVTLRVIPFCSGGFPNAGNSTLYAEGPVPQLDTVQLDVANGVALLDAVSVLAKYRAIISRTAELSLSSAASRDFIREVVREG